MKVPMVKIICGNFAAAKLAHQEPAAIFAKPTRRQSESPRCVQPASRSQVQYQVPIGIVFIDKAKSGTVDFIYLVHILLCVGYENLSANILHVERSKAAWDLRIVESSGRQRNRYIILIKDINTAIEKIGHEEKLCAVVLPDGCAFVNSSDRTGEFENRVGPTGPAGDGAIFSHEDENCPTEVRSSVEHYAGRSRRRNPAERWWHRDDERNYLACAS